MGDTMATQAQVRKFIDDNYKYDVLDSGLLKMLFTGEGGRSQLIFVAINDYNVQISSPFAKTEDVTPKQALEASTKFSLGIKLFGDLFVVAHYLELGDIDESELREGFTLTASIADDLEKELLGTDNW